MIFDAKEYWEGRENPNAEGCSIAPKFITDFVYEYTKDKSQVLEIGPGVGRLLGIYEPKQHITTVDLSTRYQAEIKNKAEKLGLTVHQTHLKRPDECLPFEDNQFEIGVCVQVLMHVPEKYIEVTLGELARTCREIVIVTSIQPGKGEHVFTHDYNDLIGNIPGLFIEKFVQVTNTGLFKLGK